MKTVHFDLLHLYYLPQFLPVAHFLVKKGITVVFVVYAEEDLTAITAHALNEEGFEYHIVDDEQIAVNTYLKNQPNWIIFGNSPSSIYAALKKASIKLGFMQHGIGPKSCYYSASEFPFDVRFVEGNTRKERLQKRFPEDTFIDVGYAKLDPLFNDQEPALSLASLELDPNKKTLLYAPTFYPSSIECLNSNWPEQLADYNLIIKPHFFSLTKPRYKKQRALLNKWAGYSNVYVSPIDSYSLLPFMSICDVMLSEASSTVFEFAALDKPVVWCDFYSVRWTYKGIFKSRLGKRLDKDLSVFEQLCERAKSPSELPDKVQYCLENKTEKSEIRKELTLSMAGITDGKCSERIVDFLLAN